MTTMQKHPDLTPEEQAALDAHVQAREEIQINDGITASFDGDGLILAIGGEGYHAQLALDDAAVRKKERAATAHLEAVAAKSRRELGIEP